MPSRYTKYWQSEMGLNVDVIQASVDDMHGLLHLLCIFLALSLHLLNFIVEIIYEV